MELINPPDLGPKGMALSQAVRVDGLVFVSGQVAFGDNDELVGAGDVGAQTRQTMARIEAILAEAGAKLTDIVSANVYLKNVEDFRAFDQAWREALGDHRPARATTQAALVSPDFLVEIQVVAQHGGQS